MRQGRWFCCSARSTSVSLTFSFLAPSRLEALRSSRASSVGPLKLQIPCIVHKWPPVHKAWPSVAIAIGQVHDCGRVFTRRQLSKRSPSAMACSCWQWHLPYLAQHGAPWVLGATFICLHCPSPCAGVPPQPLQHGSATCRRVLTIIFSIAGHDQAPDSPRHCLTPQNFHASGTMTCFKHYELTAEPGLAIRL